MQERGHEFAGPNGKFKSTDSHHIGRDFLGLHESLILCMKPETISDMISGMISDMISDRILKKMCYLFLVPILDLPIGIQML